MFFEGVFENNIDEYKDFYSNYEDIKKIKNKYSDKIKQYADENKLVVDDDEDTTDVKIDETTVEELLNKDWKCFLYYKYFDGQHDINWIINTNPNSVLFEYVFVCGREDLDFYHFSEIDDKIETIEEISRTFDLLN